MAVRLDVAIKNVTKNEPYEEYETIKHWPNLDKGVENSRVPTP